MAKWMVTITRTITHTFEIDSPEAEIKSKMNQREENKARRQAWLDARSKALSLLKLGGILINSKLTTVVQPIDEANVNLIQQ